MKTHLTRLFRYGLISSCLLSLLSCSGITYMVDKNKLKQLEQDYHDRKVSRTYYKHERARLALEINENWKMWRDACDHPAQITFTPASGDDDDPDVVVSYDDHGRRHIVRRNEGIGPRRHGDHSPVANSPAVQKKAAPTSNQSSKSSGKNKNQ